MLCFQGFSVTKQLHSICLYTDDKDLREFVVSSQRTGPTAGCVCCHRQLHLHHLYVHRYNVCVASDWLIDQVEELSGRSCFPEEQVQSVAFIKEMERLGSLPAARCAADSAAHR